MEWKILIAGLVFTLGMYAVKCGIGLAEGVVGHEKRGQSLIFAGALITHTLVFGGSYLVLTRVDLLNQYLRAQEMARWFMTVHLLLATLLLTGGSSILKQPIDEGKSMRGGWLFLLPSPICMGVILLIIAVLMGFSPERALEITSVAWIVFVVVASVSFAMARRMDTGFQRSQYLLGLVMVLTALWFLLSVLVVPHISELPDVFAMASHGSVLNEKAADGLCWPVISSLCLFCAGVVSDRFLAWFKSG